MRRALRSLGAVRPLGALRLLCTLRAPRPFRAPRALLAPGAMFALAAAAVLACLEARAGGPERGSPLAVDVAGFGARCDGRTHDTQAIQRAIDAVAARGGGAVVIRACASAYQLGAGDERGAPAIALRSNVRLVGAGRPTLRWDRSAGRAQAIEARGVERVAIEGIDVDCNRPGDVRMIDATCTGPGEPYACCRARGEGTCRWNACVQLVGVRDAVIRDVRVRDAPNFGLYVGGTADAPSAEVLVEDVRVDGANGSGLVLTSFRDVTMRRVAVVVDRDAPGGAGGENQVGIHVEPNRGPSSGLRGDGWRVDCVGRCAGARERQCLADSDCGAGGFCASSLRTTIALSVAPGAQEVRDVRLADVESRRCNSALLLERARGFSLSGGRFQVTANTPAHLGDNPRSPEAPGLVTVAYAADVALESLTLESVGERNRDIAALAFLSHGSTTESALRVTARGLSVARLGLPIVLRTGRAVTVADSVFDDTGTGEIGIGDGTTNAARDADLTLERVELRRGAGALFRYRAETGRAGGWRHRLALRDVRVEGYRRLQEIRSASDVRGSGSKSITTIVERVVSLDGALEGVGDLGGHEGLTAAVEVVR